MNQLLNSKIYFGEVMHRRTKPKVHQLNYKLFMMYIDLDELPTLFDSFLFWSKDKPNLAYSKTQDYFCDSKGSIKNAVKAEVYKRYQVELKGPIRMLTHLRYFGYCFNPVTFYYCYDESAENLDFVLSQVNNTPWNERHIYAMDNRDKRLQGENSRFLEHAFSKEFHVSPFLPPEMDYYWKFSTADKQISILMQNAIKGEKVFQANLQLEAKPINSKNLAYALTHYPMMTTKVTLGIYWNALKLWFKGATFYPNPSGEKSKTSKHAN
jgi:DUF1365 family protein